MNKILIVQYFFVILFNFSLFSSGKFDLYKTAKEQEFQDFEPVDLKPIFDFISSPEGLDSKYLLGTQFGGRRSFGRSNQPCFLFLSGIWFVCDCT